MGKRVNHNIEWLQDDDGSLYGYKNLLTGAVIQTPALAIDASGNIIAIVANQTGTLANLLTLAGSNGQIAVATDVNALVKFNGVAGQAVAYYRNRMSSLFAVKQNSIVLPTATDTTELINGSSATQIFYNDNSIFDPTTGYFTAPLNAVGLRFCINVQWSDSSVATSYTQSVKVQFYTAGFWFDYLVLNLTKSIPSTANITNISTPIYGSTTSQMRVLFNQNSGVSLTPTVNFSAEYFMA